MIVRVKYKNKKLDNVGFEDFDFDIYCQKLSQDLVSILSDIESFFVKNTEESNLGDDELYRKLRHRLFDVAGSIKRLPENIVKEEELFLKATKNNIFKTLLGRD